MNERRASIGSTSRWKLGAPGKQPAEREGVGPLEEKECRNCGGCFHGRAWNRRSALESACGSPSVRRPQMWNGDLNRPRAKTINQMIMGMTDVQVK